MKRVVVTGSGIVSCLGNDKKAVLESLRKGQSGIRFQESYAEMGLRSQVAGSIDIDIDAHIDRKVKRFMGAGRAGRTNRIVNALDVERGCQTGRYGAGHGARHHIRANASYPLIA